MSEQPTDNPPGESPAGDSPFKELDNTTFQDRHEMDPETLPPAPTLHDPVLLRGEMGFFQHLGELRRALIICAVAVLVGAIVGFSYHEPLLALLQNQIQDVQFVILSPAEGFTAMVRMSILIGLFLAVPVVLREIFWFVGPALERWQRRALIPIIMLSYLLFLGGIAFAYFLLLPLGLKFLIGFTPAGIQPMLSIDRFVGFASVLIFSTGLIFQVPIIMLVLSIFRIVQRALLVAQRRYAILVSFILAAVITPSVDIMTQSLLAGTLIILFELGLMLMWLGERLVGSKTPEY